MTGVLVAGIITDLTKWLNDTAGNWWFILVILVIAFFDSVVPIVPSETTVIIGGVAAAGLGNQRLALVIAAGATGAFLGDNTAYLIGRRMSGAIGRWAERKPKRQARLTWANTQIRQRGGLLLITARFIPGGRTALTVSSGITHQPRAWFAAWVAVAAVIWATYAALLGFVGGKAFKDDHTKAFLLAFAAAISLTVLIEIFRHTRAKRAARRDAKAASALLER